MVYAFNPNSVEAEEAGSLWVQWFSTFQASQLFNEALSPKG